MRFHLLVSFLLLSQTAAAQYPYGGCPPGGCPPGWGIGAGMRADPNGFGVGIGIGGPAVQPTPRIQPRHDPRSVIRIGDSGGYFSGVVVAGNLVLTAKHCLGDGQPSLFAEIGGESLPLEYVGISDFSEGPVVLKLPGGPYPSSRIAAAVPQRGSPAYGSGYLSGQRSPSLIVGRLSGSQYFLRAGGTNTEVSPGTPESWQANCLTAPAYGGQSGCPLFDSAGDVIGLLSSSDHQTDSQWICWSQTKLAVDTAMRRIGTEPGNPAPLFVPVPIDGGIRAEVAELKALLIQIQSRPDPAPGPPGRDGKDGKDADTEELAAMRAILVQVIADQRRHTEQIDKLPTVDMLTVIVAELRALKERPIAVPADITALKAEIAALKDTVTPVRTRRPDGTILSGENVRLLRGEAINLDLQPMDMKQLKQALGLKE